jgi:oligosaccharide repeat unit polymerase
MKIALFSICFFLFWGTLSLFSLGGLKSIGYDTYLIVFSCVVFFNFGIFCAIPRTNGNSRLGFKLRNNDQLIRVFKGFLYTQLIIYSILIYFFFLILKDIPNIGTYRILAFGSKDTPSILFRFQQVALLYWIFAFAINHVILYLGVYLNFITNRKVYLILGFLPIFLDSLVMMGRGAFVELFHILIFVVLVKKYVFKQSIISIFKRNKNFAIFIVVVLAFLISVSQLRGDVEKTEIEYVIKDQLINYNTVGFVIFDYEFHSINSYLNNTSSFPGRITFGGVENLVYLALSRIDPSVRCLIGESNENLDKMKEVDLGTGNTEKYYNAFTTVLYNTMFDGGVLWSIFYFFTYGYILTMVIRKINNDLFFIVLALPLFQNMLTSIYRSMFGDMGFVVCLLILWVISKISIAKKI